MTCENFCNINIIKNALRSQEREKLIPLVRLSGKFYGKCRTVVIGKDRAGCPSPGTWYSV